MKLQLSFVSFCYLVLQRLNRADEAIAHYQRAAELQFQNPLDCLTALNLVAECKTQTSELLCYPPHFEHRFANCIDVDCN